MQYRHSTHRRRQEKGYVLLAILFALTLLVIGLAAAAPRAATAIRRQKEDDLIRRGNQYALAIRRFYKKFGRYPANMDQLENTNNIRFLRRKYLDPLTGKDDWKPIQFGQARPSLGFFGQKVVTTGGQSPAGAGLGGSSVNGPSGGVLSNSADQSGSPLGSSTGANNSPFSGSAGSSPLSNSSSSSNSPFSSGPGAMGSPATGAPAGPTGTAGNPISTNQLSNTTFGGGAIVGFSVPSQKESLKEYEGKNHYNEWQFVYDPTVDATLRGGGVGGAGSIPGNTPGGVNPGLNVPGANPMSPGMTPGLTPTQPTGPTGATPQNPQ